MNSPHFALALFLRRDKVPRSFTFIRRIYFMAKAKKPAFGGYTISFKGCDDTVEKLFGSKPIAPSEMTKLIWAYVKKNKLASK